MINATVQLTASHYGHFEFRLCPKSSAQELVTQECLDRTVLRLTDGSTQFPIPTLDSIKYYPQIQLPSTLTCNNCVLQWRYTVGKLSLCLLDTCILDLLIYCSKLNKYNADTMLCYACN